MKKSNINIIHSSEFNHVKQPDGECVLVPGAKISHTSDDSCRLEVPLVRKITNAS
jgi:hypothetical protein